MSIDGTPRDRAQHLLVFADGVADGGGHPGLVSRARVVARDALRLCDELDAERMARQSIQKQRDEAIELLARHAYEAIPA